MSPGREGGGREGGAEPGGPARPRMPFEIDLDILPQPDDTTCGPTCLHAIYKHLGDEQPLEKLIRKVQRLEGGGTLAVLMGVHALRRGYEVVLYSYNLHVFDPTWFPLASSDLAAKLRAQLAIKTKPRLRTAIKAYLEFIERGGEVRFADLTVGLVRSYLKRGIPVVAGISATWLYRSARELGEPLVPDDLRGFPQGHFVLLCGYDPDERNFLVADPLQPNPIAPAGRYVVDADRLVCSMLLGVITYDANILIVRPERRPPEEVRRDPARRRRTR